MHSLVEGMHFLLMILPECWSRFASIYKDFEVVDDFKNFIKSLNKN